MKDLLNSSPLVIGALSAVGTVLNIFLFISPWRQLKRLSTNKDSPDVNLSDLTAFPYLSMTINCLFWITYCLLTANNLLVFVNGLGFILSLYYNWLFFTITERKETFVTQCSIALSLYIAGLLYILFLVDAKNMVHYLGLLAATASITMIGAPLIQLRTVIKRRNADSIPGSLALAATLCSFTWGMYGVLVKDGNIFYPNAIGTVLGTAQLLLKLIFKGKKPQVFSLLPDSLIIKGDKK